MRPKKGAFSYLQDCFYAALRSRLGVALTISGDPEQAMIDLRSVRMQEPIFRPIGVYISPTDPKKIWLVNKEALNAARSKPQKGNAEVELP